MSSQVNSKIFKKTLVILCIVAGIEILFTIIGGLYITTTTSLTHTTTRQISIASQDIIPTDFEIKQQPQIANLEILPEYYDTLTKNLGTFSAHDLTTYLRYSQLLKTKDTTNITNGYSYLKESNLNLLIPQAYIDEYILAKTSEISKDILARENEKSIFKPYIAIDYSTSLFNDLHICIAQNIDLFLSQDSCKTIIEKISNEQLTPTLSFLTKSLSTSAYTSNDEYDRYIHNQLYIYQIYQKNQLPITTTTNTSITNDTYLELDQTHLKKVKMITEYLNKLYLQLGYDNSSLKNKIQSLDSFVTTLSNYKIGDSLPNEIATIISDPILNITQNTNLPISPDALMSFLVKSFNVNGEIKTYVAPIYTFSATDGTKINALTFQINDNNFNEPYDVTVKAQSNGSTRIPIFMFHQIVSAPVGSNSFKAGLYIDPKDFEKEMAYLVKKNYKTINSLEYYNILKTGKNPSQKTVMLTFDDGTENQYTNAYPILKKYGLTGVFFIISQRSGITHTQAKIMSDGGMDIGSHSARHPDLTKVYDPAQLSSEIISSKYALQSAIDKTVYSFAYPGCGWNSQTLSYVVNAGYLLGMSCGNTIDNRFSYRLVLSRVHASGDLKSFKNQLSGQLWSY